MLLIEFVRVINLLLLRLFGLRVIFLTLSVVHVCNFIHLLEYSIYCVVRVHLINSFLTHLLCYKCSILLPSVATFIPSV